MTRLQRKDLKQDEIRAGFQDAVRGVRLHGKEILSIILVVLAVAVIASGWYFYHNKQLRESQNLLGKALEKFNAPVGEQPPGTPKPVHQFKTETEKYTEALKDFEQVIREYGSTPAAKIARYMAGVSAFYLNDTARAEDYLKQSGNISDQNLLYYQSRIALSQVYLKSGKEDQAIQLLKELSEKEKPPIPQETLLLQLADAYDKAGKEKEAKETYQKIVDQYKDSPARFQAQTHLDEAKE